MPEATPCPARTSGTWFESMVLAPEGRQRGSRSGRVSVAPPGLSAYSRHRNPGLALWATVCRPSGTVWGLGGPWLQPWGTRIGWLTLLFSASVAIAQCEPTELKPDWVRSFERGVEWCAPVGGEPVVTLLVCTKDARVDLIDLKTGRSRLAEPIRVQPGMRFAGATGNVAYCYSVSQVYAFQVERNYQAKVAKAGLLWRVAAAPKAQTAGDPEFLTRIVAAKATPMGVLVVRSDGRVAELLQKNGNVRWRYKLPKSANCMLRVRDALVGLLWKDGEAFKVAFHDLRHDPPRPLVTSVNATLPIWVELIDDGLVAVWPGRFAVIPIEGEPRFYDMDKRIRATAATVAVYSPALAAKVPATLFVLGENGVLYVYAPDGTARAEARGSSRKVLSGAIRVVGNLVFAAGTRWFCVYDADRGNVIAEQSRPAFLVDVVTHRGFAYGLFLEDGLSAQPDNPRTLSLVRQALIELPSPCRKAAAAPVACDYILGKAGPIRDTFWLGGTLVVVEDKRVRVYTLP